MSCSAMQTSQAALQRIGRKRCRRTLGVRRTSVTDVACQLQQQGLIQYQRGIIHVLDRPGLEAASCECYGKLRHDILALSGNLS